MGSKKISKVGNQPPGKKTTEKASVKPDNGVRKKSVRNTGRTYRKDDSSFRDELSGGLEDVGALFKFVGKKIGSFFYSYYELGCAVTGAIRDGAAKLKQGVSFLFRSKASSNEESILTVVPEAVTPVTMQADKPKSVVTSSSVQITKFRGNPSPTDTQPSKLERKLITIEMSEVEGLAPSQAANILLGKITEIPAPNKKVISFLDDIVQGEPFERAARYFGSSHRSRRCDERLDSVMNNARVALTSFIARNTNNQAVAERITEIICVRDPRNQHLQIVEDDITPEIAEEITEQNQILAEPVSVSVISDEGRAVVLPMRYPSTILPDTVRRIQSYQDTIGLDSKVSDAFLQTVRLGENIYSTLSPEEVILRVGFLQALSGLKIKNGADKLSDDLFTLECEYQAFLQYCQADDSVRVSIGNMLDNSSSSNLHAYSTKRDLALFLGSKENDAFRLARAFIRNIIKIDTNGVGGAIRLFKQAVEKEKLNPAYVFGYYVKAEAAVSLSEVFNRNCIPPDIARMEIMNPNKTEKEDIRIETGKRTYLIKIKSSFRRAVEGIEEMKSIATIARGRTRGFQLFSSNSSSDGKEIIPVCVVNGAGSTLIDLERRIITEKTDREFYMGLRDLVSIKRDFPQFELWDINGKSILSELKSEVTPGIGIFNTGLGA